MGEMFVVEVYFRCDRIPNDSGSFTRWAAVGIVADAIMPGGGRRMNRELRTHRIAGIQAGQYEPIPN